MNSYTEALKGLPGQEHGDSGILAEIPWSILPTLFPRFYIVQEFNKKLEPIKKYFKELCD